MDQLLFMCATLFPQPLLLLYYYYLFNLVLSEHVESIGCRCFQQGKVANSPARGQLKRENDYFPVRCYTIHTCFLITPITDYLLHTKVHCLCMYDE